jgi:hypothetical protein
LDTEWLLSTLFDASLLSTSKAAGNGGSFFARFAALVPIAPQRAAERRHQSHQIAGTICPSEVRKAVASRRLAVFERQDAGNHKNGCGWTLVRERAMICSS